MKTTKLLSALALTGLFAAGGVQAGDGNVTLIHIGDLHGHMIPRANVRSDAQGHGTEGGLARIYTKVKEIRAEEPDALLINTGDTIQGSAEVLYTKGDAIVGVLNDWNIDAFAPGNWEFVYGTARFEELFAGSAAKAPWGAVAANLYRGSAADCSSASAGLPPVLPRVLPAYSVKVINGVRVGILGFTTDRGPTVVGKQVIAGYCYTKGDAEVRYFVDKLRNEEQVDLVVMISELGLANNVRLTETYPGVDVVLSSDMHEETMQPVVTKYGTVIVEEGQDGTMMGKLKLTVKGGRMSGWKWKAYRVSDDIPEDAGVAAKVAEARRTFVTGPDFTAYQNPFNGSKLKRPIDTVVGYTAKPLYRANFSQENMPGVLEGSSHDFLTDAFRAMTGAQVGAIRGFRYGTHVPVGPIKLEDLYHFLPIGPQIAVGKVSGQNIQDQINAAADGSLNPRPEQWTGGWLFNFSGMTMSIDPYVTEVVPPARFPYRASNIRVAGEPLDLAAYYTYGSYWYATEPGNVNGLPAKEISVLKDDDGNPMDATEVVVKYLQSLPGNTADPVLNRIKLVDGVSLPAPKFGFPEVQPLRGAQP